MKNPIFVNGGISKPKSIGPQIIGHICNDLGIWRGRNAREIARGWPESERAYNRWFRDRFHNEFGLGAIQFVNVNRTHANQIVRVANMVAERGTRYKAGVRPIRYKVLAGCLARLAQKALRMSASIHLPQIGMNGSNVHWPLVLEIVKDSIDRFRIPVFIYQQPTDTTDQMFARVIDPPTRRRFELIDSYAGRLGR